MGREDLGSEDTGEDAGEDGEPFHDFTGLPLTRDGWHDLDALISSEGYAEARVIYVSNDGGAGQVYTQQEVLALGGRPTLPATAPNAFGSLSEAWEEIRDGHTDVLLIERGATFPGTIVVGKSGVESMRPLIVAAYGDLEVARPLARLVTNNDASNVFIASLDDDRSNEPAGSITYQGSSIFIEDVIWRGPADSTREVILPMLNGGSAAGGLGGGMVRRSTSHWTAFFAGDWGGAAQTPSRFEENSILRSAGPPYSSIYFAEGARNIESIFCQSILGGNAGWRQRDGGTVRGVLIAGMQPNFTFGGGFDVLNNLEFIDNVSMHTPGPDRVAAMSGATIRGNIFSQWTNFGGLQVLGNYSSGDGQVYPGVQGATVFEDNIFYMSQQSGILSYDLGDDSLLPNLQPGATLTFRGNDFVKTNGGAVLNATGDERLIWGPGNRYFSSAARSEWFSNRSFDQMVPTSGEALTSLESLYPDPDRNMLTYLQFLGASPSSVEEALNWYVDGAPGEPSVPGALANRRGAWDEGFTSRAFINYIRAGFGVDPI